MASTKHKRMNAWVLILLLFAGQQLKATNQIILNPVGSNNLVVLKNTFQQLQVSNSISSINTLRIQTEKGEFVELLAESYSKSNVVGAPQLPVITRLIEIPADATPRVKIISYKLREYKLSDWGITQKLFPAQAPKPKNDEKPSFAFNRQVYETNGFHGEELARVEVAGYLRSVRLASLIISPVEYNPVTNTIRVYNNLVVEVQFDGANSVKTDEIKAATRSAYFSGILSDVLNNQTTDAPINTISAVPVKYVIVADPMFKEALQPFINWKIKKGFRVIDAYTDDPAVGKSSASIKAYLKNQYTSATAAEPAPTFVLFVGDVDQIPAFDCGSHVSDLYYCEYTGDYLPEVYYGRFSANTVGELLPQINKTLQYEQYLFPDPSYLNEVVMVAGADAECQMVWSNGQINYGTDNYFNAAHNLVSHTYLQPEPTGANYSQNIRNDISLGVSYANYTAHGNQYGWDNPAFSVENIAGLANKDKYCLMVGNCCETNSYNRNSFGEALLRAENKGALGYIGASDKTFWDEDYWWGVGNGPIVPNPTYQATGPGAYDRTFHDHGEPRSEWYSTMGQMVFAGNHAVQASNSPMKKYYWEIYCLMGDPSLMVYFSVPPAMTIDHQPLIPLGSQTFEVHTEPYAYVALSKNNILNGAAEADESGLASISLLPFTEPGFASIVVTKQNRKPIIDSIRVATPDGPFLILESYLIKDQSGSKNPIPEFNQQLKIDLTVKNIGDKDAVGAVTTLTSKDPYLTIPKNAFIWPLIKSSSSAYASNALGISINEYVPDMHTAILTATTRIDTCTFITEISFQIRAPKLLNSQIIINDTKYGNGNWRIDPGEKVNISVITSNNGHCSSSEVTTRLFVISDDVSTTSPPINIGVLGSDASGSSEFSFIVSPYTLPGSVFSVYAVSEAGAYNSTATLSPTVGLQLEDFETGNFDKYSWNMAGYKPWTIAANPKTEGSFSARSGVINHNEKSEISIEGYVFIPDSISFYRKVSTQSGHDFLRFYIDGIEAANWSGNKDWTRLSYMIPAGNHRFTWSYEKDSSNSVLDDAAWIDYIKFPPFSPQVSDPLTIKTLAVPSTICKGEQSQLYALAAGGNNVYSYQWTPVRSLNNSGIFNPLASPAETTTYYVHLSDPVSASDSVTICVEPPPDPPIVSLLNNQLESSSTQRNQWYNEKGIIPGATAQIFVPVSTDSYYVTTSSAAGCESEASNSIFWGFQNIQSPGINNISVYPNPFTEMFSINYNLNSGSHIRIVITDAIGNEVGVAYEGNKTGGNHQSTFNGSPLSTGVYYCKIFTDTAVQVLKMVKK